MATAGTASTDLTCAACKLGETWSPVDSGEKCRAVRTLCPAGEYMDNAATPTSDRTCAPCDDGFFKQSAGNEACAAWKTCPVGHGKTVEGTRKANRECAACDPVEAHHFPRTEGGSFSDTDSGDACTLLRTCAQDEYQTQAPTPSSDRVCATHRDTCPANQYTSVGVSAHDDRVCSVIRTCVAGKYQTAAPGPSSNRECAACGVGTFQDQQDQLSCTKCAAGKRRNTANAASSAEATACSSCVPGMYQRNAGMTSCAKCAAGSYQPAVGQTSCTACGAGTYQPEQSKTACIRCVIGKFRSATIAASQEPNACTTCANRKYAISYDSVQDDTCKIAECPGDMVLRSNKCVRDGGYSAWGTWGLCTDEAGQSNAGEGSAIRTRTCTKPSPRNGGNVCEGSSTDTRSCRNGGWTVWGTRRHRKGGCTKTCGGGKQTRFCQSPVPLHGAACQGSTEQTCNDFDCTPSVACTHMTCIHDGGLLQVTHHHKDHEAGHTHHHCMYHSDVGCKCMCNQKHAVPHDHLTLEHIRSLRHSEDNHERGEHAAHMSTRTQPTPAPTPPPVYAQEQLIAATLDAQDGGWTDWSGWSTCRPDTQDHIRVRSCTNPWPEHGGKDCEGSDEETKPC